MQKLLKKQCGAKTSLKMIRNSTKLANICADVVGDICGVLSGAISTLISVRLIQKLGMPTNIQFIISAAVAAITVGGKAIGKEIADRKSTEIVYAIGKIVSNFKSENK